MEEKQNVNGENGTTRGDGSHFCPLSLVHLFLSLGPVGMKATVTHINMFPGNGRESHQ